MERRLAAILAADVVGYSRLMGEDEAGTHAGLQAHRRELVDPKIAEHNGRIVKLTGDGALVEFASVVNAVECAVGIQRGMVERNSNVPEDRRIEFRMGINLGDIIVEEDDIYGDGVNLAARLEALAAPGGISVSRTVFDHVRNKVELSFDDLGEREFKNIAEPVQVYQVQLDSTSVPRIGADQTQARWREALVVPTGPSIAVMPFANLGGAPEQEYFSDGITEEIIAALTRHRELRVLARSTTFQYKGQTMDVRQLGRQLGVEYVLEGSIRRAADTIRVTAQLIDASSGAPCWAESYEADLTPANVFDVQDEIRGKVVNAVASSYDGAIATSRLVQARGKPPQNLSAYECVLTAMQWYRSLSETTARRAYDCLKSTVQIDPNYADAWALLAYLYATDYAHEFGLEVADGSDLRLLALESATRAVELDPSSATAGKALTRAYLANGDLAKFSQEAERTLLLSPNDVDIGIIGNWIGYTGKWDEGKALVQKAIALNPSTHPRWYWYVFAKHHFQNQECEAALDYFHRSYISGHWLSQLQYAYTYAALGEESQASAAVTKLLGLKPGYAIDNAVHFYRAYGFQPSYTDLMAEGLRKAGLPERRYGAGTTATGR